ncbi:hypothetical protein PR003_g6415 [Phytophthora rubi]|uniref:Uncharacterized protein n=1 Tax=Phytophthora rubi TaxID=129364 RepID=A0A6A4FSG8_9STRA|nr:hypothetical protein PR003_g6415 [Phytophthora rubi]
MIYVTDRKTEAGLARASESSAPSQRSQVLSILGDIRRQLDDIEKATVTSADDDEAKDEDRAELFEERKSCIAKIRPYQDSL